MALRRKSSKSYFSPGSIGLLLGEVLTKSLEVDLSHLHFRICLNKALFWLIYMLPMYYLLISSECEKDRKYYLLASAQNTGHSSQAMTLFHKNIASSITSRAVSSELLAWQEGMAFSECHSRSSKLAGAHPSPHVCGSVSSACCQMFVLKSKPSLSNRSYDCFF